jgi:hypothetical protein
LKLQEEQRLFAEKVKNLDGYSLATDLMGKLEDQR